MVQEGDAHEATELGDKAEVSNENMANSSEGDRAEILGDRFTNSSAWTLTCTG